MNLLAHAFLSPDDPGVLAGNVAGDWIKGRARLGLPAEVRAGMALHRRIDAFTDTHAVVAGAAELFWERWGRYSPVLVDIFFDHILAANWGRHSGIPLERFCRETYGALAGSASIFPERCRMAIGALIREDWFGSYATVEGIRLSLGRLSARLRHGIDLAPAADDLAARRGEMEEAFEAFFPELRRHVGAARPEGGQSGFSLATEF